MSDVSESESGSRLYELRREAGALWARGAFAEACERYEILREELAKLHDARDASVAEVLQTMGGVARQGGDLRAARRYFEQARDLVAPSQAESINNILANLDPLPLEELERRPMLTLTHQRREHTAGGPSAVVVMVYNLLYIGRGIDRAHLLVRSPQLSRIHARVVWRANAFELEDCRSENGTFFGGEMIDRRVIRDGDIYTMGDQTITCHLTQRRG